MELLILASICRTYTPMLVSVPVEVPANPENRKYLSTKRDKLGHLLSSLPD